MRRVLSVCGLVCAAALAACGLSEMGLLDTDGGADAGVPDACATLDAACLSTLGAEWKPVSIGDGGCAPGFTANALVTNPRLLDGGCACGACQVTGSFACNGPTRISGGNNCDDPALAQAPTGQCTQAHAQHLQAYVSQATAGTLGCTAANDAGAGGTGDAVTACIPTSCTADFCGGGSVCAMAAGDLACPSGFTLFGHVGTGVDPGCAACACDASAPGNCAGNVTGFETTDCTDGGLVHTYAVGTCNVFDNSTDYSSVLVTLVPPDASCTVASAAIAGDASLAGEKTICCKP